MFLCCCCCSCAVATCIITATTDTTTITSIEQGVYNVLCGWGDWHSHPSFLCVEVLLCVTCASYTYIHTPHSHQYTPSSTPQPPPTQKYTQPTPKHTFSIAPTSALSIRSCAISTTALQCKCTAFLNGAPTRTPYPSSIPTNPSHTATRLLNPSTVAPGMLAARAVTSFAHLAWAASAPPWSRSSARWVRVVRVVRGRVHVGRRWWRRMVVMEA